MTYYYYVDQRGRVRASANAPPRTPFVAISRRGYAVTIAPSPDRRITVTYAQFIYLGLGRRDYNPAQEYISTVRRIVAETINEEMAERVVNYLKHILLS